MSKILAFAVAVAICVPVPLRAHGQSSQTEPKGGSTQPIDEVRKNYRLHAGPFYVNPSVMLKEVGVDSNVFNESADPRSDFTFTLAPVADIAVPMARRGLLKATLGTDLVYYATYSSERSVDPQVTLRGEAYARRITLFAEDAYLNTRQRPNYEIDLRSRHRENDLQGGLAVQITPKLSTSLAYRLAETKYDADAVFDGTSLQQTLNRETSGPVASVRVRRSALTTLGVRGDWLTDTFEFAPERDSRSYRVMAGAEFKPRALISGFAWLGYREFTPGNPAVLPAFNGLVADLGLSYTLLGSTTFSVTYHRDLTYSYEVEQPFFIDNSVGLAIRRALGGKFDAIASVSRHTYEYRDLLTVPSAGFDPRTDITWVYGANVGYRLQRSTRLGFGANYYQRDSNRVSFVNYDGLRIGATVTYGS